MAAARGRSYPVSRCIEIVNAEWCRSNACLAPQILVPGMSASECRERQLRVAMYSYTATPMYRCELCIVDRTASSAAPAPAGDGAACALYIVTAPEGTASTLCAGDSGASWCRDAVTASGTLTREKPVSRVAVKSLPRSHNALVKRKWQSRTRKTMSSSRLTNLAARQARRGSRRSSVRQLYIVRIYT
jgi:hypothetical protein